MTEDIRVLLDQAAQKSPPQSLDADLIVTGGRRRVRRRRLALACGTTFGIAAVTAAAVAVASLTGPAGGTGRPDAAGSPSASAPAVQPPSDLPLLDPEQEYYWATDDRVDDTTGAKLTEDLVSAIRALYPEAKSVRVVTQDGDVDPELLPLDSLFKVSRYQGLLQPMAGGPGSGGMEEPVYKQPVYELWDQSPKHPADAHSTMFQEYGGARLALDGEGKDREDWLTLAIFPAGGFLPGTDNDTRSGEEYPANGHLVQGCDPYTAPDVYNQGSTAEFTFDCNETTTPEGERILTIASHVTREWGTRTTHTVLVIRADGTGLVIRDKVSPSLESTGTGDYSTPTMSLDQLTQIARSIPLVPIEK